MSADTNLKKIDLDKVRNIGVIAHIDAGKTTTTERLLYFTGKIHQAGDVDEGNTTMDYLPEEQKRGVTIVAAATTCYWDVNDLTHRINIIDTPGHVDFTAEVERSLRVLDGAVVIFDGKSGVQAQTETVWRQADKYSVPRICFINKLNLIGGNFYSSLDSIQERLHKNAVAIQLPIGSEHKLLGCIDLLTEKAYMYTDEEKLEMKEVEMPDDMKDKVKEYRAKLVEAAVEFDDKLMQDYFDGKEISIEDLKRVIRIGVLAGKLYPVAGGDSRTGVVRFLLDMIVEYLPSPIDLGAIEGVTPDGKVEAREFKEEEPLSALVFKVVTDEHVGTISYVRVYSGVLKAGTYVWNSTGKFQERASRALLIHANRREDIPELKAGEIGGLVGLKKSKTGDTLCDKDKPIILEQIKFPEPVVSASIEPETKSDADKLGDVLNKVMVEDPTIKVKVDSETGQTIISGMGKFHLVVISEILERQYGVKLTLGEPKVSYKESIEKSVEKESKYVKQSGGRGQYGHCVLRVEPQERGKGFEFVDAIKGGAIPKEFIPAVRKGVEEAMQAGILAGYPVVDVKVTLFDGSYHDVDSSEVAFKIAGSIAFKEAQKAAGSYLLEPIMKMELVIPEKYFGDVTGILSGKRAQIQDTGKRGDLQVINAIIPLSETFDLSNRLRAATSGRAVAPYMEFSHYEKVPTNVATEIIEGKKSES